MCRSLDLRRLLRCMVRFDLYMVHVFGNLDGTDQRHGRRPPSQLKSLRMGNGVIIIAIIAAMLALSFVLEMVIRFA